ncbi:MAG: YlmC/YmxH family sporulation protein [Oscillospiraceae bacterium]|nr:YlmC/YmxH family sporulation protein [Oscillospiraceae bacterium]
MKCTLSDLRYKEVINIKTGQRLGFVSDAEIDMTDGRITALIVPGQRKMGGLVAGDSDFCLPWDSINLMGDDIILTDVSRPMPRRKPDRKPGLMG